MFKRLLKRIPAFFASLSILLTSCSESVNKGLDNYFKDFAISDMDGDSKVSNESFNRPPFYRMVKTNNEMQNVFFSYDSPTQNLTSVITGKTIPSDRLFYGNLEGFLFFTTPGEIKRIYDVFGNAVDINQIEPTIEHVNVFINTKSNEYARIFGVNPETNNLKIEILDRYKYCGRYFFKRINDSTTDFSLSIPISEYDTNFHLPYRNINYYEYVNDYEVITYDSNGDTQRYWVDKNDKDCKVNNKSVTIDTQYKDLFRIEYSKFNYYYSVEKTDVTNDFDFYISEDFADFYNIKLTSGNYKIHSSHFGKYFPLSVFPSPNHDYLWCLCLKIGKNKIIEPTYYAVKIYGKKSLSKFSDNVNCMLGLEQYIRFNNRYVLLNTEEYKSLFYVNKDFCYILNADPKSKNNETEYLNINYVSDDSYISSRVAGRLAISIPSERKLFLSNKEANRFEMIDTLDGSSTTLSYSKLVDLKEILYYKNNNLFFRDIVIDSNTSEEDLSQVFKYDLSTPRMPCYYLEYANKDKSRCYYLVCREAKYEV